MTIDSEMEAARAAACEVARRIAGMEEATQEGLLQAALVQVAVEMAVDAGPAFALQFAAFLRVMAGLTVLASDTKGRTGITPKMSETEVLH